MKKIYTLFILLVALFFTVSCNNDDNSEGGNVKAKRTIIVYITSDNDINSSLQEDMSEIIKGSKNLSSDCNLIVFADFRYQKPYICKVKNGSKTIVKQWDEDFYSTSPDMMLDIYEWIIKNYPAQEYATVIEGHGSGSIIQTKDASSSNDTIATDMVKLYAYGYDETNKNSSNIRQWINIPSMATVFSHLPHMEYIFFDCCCMGNAETVYELRKYTDYIIAPVSETPAKGAPYESIIPILSKDKDEVGKAIINSYVNNSGFSTNKGICISCYKTSEIENFCNVTRKCFHKLNETKYSTINKRIMLDIKNVTYYYNISGHTFNLVPALFDIKSLFYKNELNTEYLNEWQQAADKLIVATYPISPDNFKWATSFGVNSSPYTFDCDIDNYSGISMFIPLEQYNTYASSQYAKSLNISMFSLEWTNKMGWHELGW